MNAALVVVLFAVFAAVDAQVCFYGQLRLVGGSSSREGRVEICIDGQWGTVCDVGWSTTDAMVVCRQLGYPVGTVTAPCCTTYGPGSGPIFLYDVGCSGSEDSLLDCAHRGISSHNCYYGGDAGAICPPCVEGSVQLTNGLIPQEGLVEVCLGGSWRGVCDSSWDYKDAFVVCRQLGYPVTDASPFHNAFFGERLTTPKDVTNVLCYGDESRLLDCNYSNTSFCSATNAAGLRCQGQAIPEPPCFENTIRLAGGEHANLGRVEICSNGVWGTICDGSYWDIMDATVVCKQLGYQNPRVFPYRSYQSQRYFTEGTGPILFADLTCNGTELSLAQCSSSSPNAEYCSHSNDVGVRCDEIEASVIDTCTDGEVRLADGETVLEGRVEICIGNVWGSVCDDSWDGLDAAVVCNQLGFPTAMAEGLSDAFYGEGRGPYHLDNVRCDGDEPSLLECSHNTVGIHNCLTGMDAGVRCNASDCDHGSVRLVDGATSYEGRLEVCINRQWTTVCDDGFSSTSASIVCQQLFGENITAQYYSSARFGQGTGRILDDVNCTGSESSLINCPYTELTSYTSVGCYHYEDVSIRCYMLSNCADGDVRLVDGKNEQEGRVEVCQNRVWGAIANRWTFQEAKVVCIQLGYASAWAVPLTNSFFGRGTAPILIYYTSCSGEETIVEDCDMRTISPASTSFYTNPVVGVVCQGNLTSETECTPGDIRLVGGQTETEGRAEVCMDGFWGTVCEVGWDESDALVFCRQAGLSTTATSVTTGFFGEGIGPIMSNLSCSSRESNITQCEGEVGTPDCHHGRDVGVRCQGKQDYNITLTTAEVGPFRIGTNVVLLCLVEPELPLSQDIQYTWTTSVTNLQLVATNTSFPNATLSITAGHPRQGQYYCHVHRREFLLGVGTGSIEVQSLLRIIGQQNIQYIPPHPVTLSVEVNPKRTAYNFRALTWFHNGVQITSDDRIVISESTETLSILNTTDADSGVYEVKFTGLLVRPYARKCEQDVLALLRHYPVAEAAVFHLYTNTLDVTVQVLTDNINFETPSVLPFADSQNLSLTITGIVHTLIDETVSTAWYFNGAALRDGITIGPLKSPLLSISQTLEIENTNILDSGFYEVTLIIQPYTHLVSHLQCPTEYSDFVTDFVGIDNIVLARDVVQLVDSGAFVQENPMSSNTSAIAGGSVGGIVAVILLLVIVIACLLWYTRRSRKSAEISEESEPTTGTKKSPEKTESACYTNAAEDVQLGPNISYEQVDYPQYPGEVIYDKVN